MGQGHFGLFVGAMVVLSPVGVYAQGADPSPTPAPETTENSMGEPEANDRAQELYDNGAALYQEGRYEDAILAFEESYRLSREPLLLYNIANAYERMGRYQDAIDALSRYRAFAPSEERDALIRRIANIEARLAEMAPEPTPDPTPEPTPIPVVEPPPEAAKALPTQGDEGPAVEPSGEDGPLGGIPLWVPIVAGGSLATLALGAGAGIRSLNYTQEAAAFCVTTASGELICSAEADVPLACAKRDALVADVALSLGVGAAIVSGIGLLRYGLGAEGEEDAMSKGVSVAPWLTPGTSGLQLTGRF